jgi:hypothetical protein
MSGNRMLREIIKCKREGVIGEWRKMFKMMIHDL